MFAQRKFGPRVAHCQVRGILFGSRCARAHPPPPPHTHRARARSMAPSRSCCSVDLIQQLSILGFLLIAAFSSVFGTLLAIFVPQKCFNTVSGSNTLTGNVTTIGVFNDCTLAQNIYVDIGPFNAFVLAFNFLSLALILGGYSFEFLRERFIVIAFDVDYEKSADHLDRIDFKDGKHAALKEKLVRWNRAYRGVFIAIAFVSLCNIVLSGILVFSTEYYSGYRTATTFVSNILFLLTRLSNSIILSSTSSEEPKAQSINLVENLNFNVVAVQKLPRSPSAHGASTTTLGPPLVVGPSAGPLSSYPYPDDANAYPPRFDMLGLGRGRSFQSSRYGHGTEV